VPSALYDAYVEVLGPGFPMDVAACDRLTKGALAACHKSVSAAVRCWKGVGKALGKGAKTTCNEQGDQEQLCLDGTGAELDNLKSNVEASEADGHASCDANAEGFWFVCVNGVP
jgi:hypothetical protein